MALFRIVHALSFELNLFFDRTCPLSNGFTAMYVPVDKFNTFTFNQNLTSRWYSQNVSADRRDRYHITLYLVVSSCIMSQICEATKNDHDVRKTHHICAGRAG